MKMNGIMIALAAGSLFAAACNKDAGSGSQAKASEKTEMVKCKGVNECKGHGACKSEANACAGQNGCKGQGFVETAATECTQKGGTVMTASK